jgi:hypothetical protein
MVQYRHSEIFIAVQNEYIFYFSESWIFDMYLYVVGVH